MAGHGVVVTIVALQILAAAVTTVALIGRQHSSSEEAAPAPVVSTPRVDQVLVHQFSVWVADNLPRGAAVLMPAMLSQTAQRELPGYSVVPYSRAGTVPVDFVVVDRSATSTTSGPAAAVIDNSFPVGRSERGGLETRQVLMRSAITPAADRVVRREGGSELVDNGALDVGADAQSALRSGSVDSRLMLILSGLVSEHVVQVEFPRDPVAADSPRRTAYITSIDGVEIDRDPSIATVAKRFVAAQPAAVRPVVVRRQEEAGRTVLVLRYSLPVPLGYLDGGSLPTIPAH